VLEALGYSSRPEVPALIEAAFKRGNPEWVASALLAMGRSQDDERWSEPVITMLLSENNEVRLEAVRAAGELELAEARLPLLRLLDDEDDSDVFSAAIWSLSQIGGEDVRTYLENLLDTSEDDDVVEFIEDALANLSFNEDLAMFDLLAVDDDDDLHEVEDLDEDEDDEAPKRTKTK
jgi:HEAT repeat protein